MAATSALSSIPIFSTGITFGNSPATAALEEANKRSALAKTGKRAGLGSKRKNLPCRLFDITFEDDSVDSFPAIEWDNLDDDSDSESERSTVSFSSFLADFDESASLGKRGRGETGGLVRSKKFKSGLSSLANSA